MANGVKSIRKSSNNAEPRRPREVRGFSRGNSTRNKHNKREEGEEETLAGEVMCLTTVVVRSKLRFGEIFWELEIGCWLEQGYL